LLSQLYINTLRALKAGSTDSPNSTELIRSKKTLAAQQLISRRLSEERIEQIWANNPDEYFERESVNNIVWHTQEQLKAVPGKPLVAVKELEANDHPEGATLIFIHTEDAEFLFAKTTAAFERLRLNIVNARVITSLNAFCLDTYTVLEPDGKPVGANPRRVQEIETILLQNLAQTTDNIRPATYRRSRKLRYFNEPITTVLTNTPGKGYSTLEINCPDQPGILATLGKVIADNQLLIVDARITTLGERVEDIFCLKDHKGRPIIDPDVERDLLEDIENRLSERLAG
jgi:[protein-PII] uridylyltransferase